MAGKIVHFELPSKDTARAKAFWGGTFGWEFSNPMAPAMEYWMTQTGEDQGGAIYPDAEKTGMTVYFDTEDIDATVAAWTKMLRHKAHRNARMMHPIERERLGHRNFFC